MRDARFGHLRLDLDPQHSPKSEPSKAEATRSMGDGERLHETTDESEELSSAAGGPSAGREKESVTSIVSPPPSPSSREFNITPMVMSMKPETGDLSPPSTASPAPVAGRGVPAVGERTPTGTGPPGTRIAGAAMTIGPADQARLALQLWWPLLAGLAGGAGDPRLDCRAAAMATLRDLLKVVITIKFTPAPVTFTVKN